MKEAVRNQITPICDMTHDELIERYQDLIYSSNPNRAKEVRLVSIELLRRRELTLEWMAVHPLEVERIAREIYNRTD